MRLRERGKRVRIRSQAASPRPVPVLEPTGRFYAPAPKPVAARVRPKRRARRVAPLWGWLWRNAEPLLWGAVLGALALSLWFSPRTQLTRLEAAGVPSEAHAELYALLNPHLQPPIALRDTPRHLERAVQSLDWVQQARWQATGVGQARLTVAPREPFAEIQTANGARLFADPTGVLFRPPNPDAKPTSGVIRLAQDDSRLRTGGYVEGEMQAALTILHAVSRRADVHRPRVQVSRTHGIRLFAQIQRGAEPPVAVQLRFGDASALEQQLPTMHRLLDTPLADLRQWEYVDISAPGSEAVKPRATMGGQP
ncbi:MAG: hypothetical protein K6U77_03375 [Armatimonadetes bacterium]|nr:hypothetical protein [Armatimonadota bacterium]